MISQVRTDLVLETGHVHLADSVTFNVELRVSDVPTPHRPLKVPNPTVAESCFPSHRHYNQHRCHHTCQAPQANQLKPLVHRPCRGLEMWIRGLWISQFCKECVLSTLWSKSCASCVDCRLNWRSQYSCFHVKYRFNVLDSVTSSVRFARIVHFQLKPIPSISVISSSANFVGKHAVSIVSSSRRTIIRWTSRDE